jgi:hypothetical protein
MRRLLALTGLVMTACTSTLPAPGASVLPIPLAVPCQTNPIERPAFATSRLPPESDIFDKVKALLAERLQRQAYEERLEAALSACN